jgi:hypothetical protein
VTEVKNRVNRRGIKKEHFPLCFFLFIILAATRVFLRALVTIQSVIISFVANTRATVNWCFSELYLVKVLLQQYITMATTEKNSTDYYRWSQSVPNFIFSVSPVLYSGSLHTMCLFIESFLCYGFISVTTCIYCYYISTYCEISVFSDTDAE